MTNVPILSTKAPKNVDLRMVPSLTRRRTPPPFHATADGRADGSARSAPLTACTGAVRPGRAAIGVLLAKITVSDYDPSDPIRT